MDQLKDIRDLCRRMEDLAFEADLPRFDRVRLTTGAGGADELWFFWEEREICVVVELSADPAQLSAALARATSGNPILN